MNTCPPTETELRRAERASWGRQPLAANRHSRRSEAKIRKWAAYRNPAGTMLGFVSAELPSGQIINDLKLMVRPKGRRWIAMPATRQLDQDDQPQLDANGKPLWKQIIEFRGRATGNKFQEQILEAIRQQHPEVFDDEARQQ
jgi:hypothetical protein